MKRTVMLIIFQLVQTIGYYGFTSWVPTLLASQGVDFTKSLAYTSIIAVASNMTSRRTRWSISPHRAPTAPAA